MANTPQRNIQVLKFIEQDRGLVHLVSMPFIPKEKRWSSLYKVEFLPKDFVPEDQCQRESSTGLSRLLEGAKGSCFWSANCVSGWLIMLGFAYGRLLRKGRRRKKVPGKELEEKLSERSSFYPWMATWYRTFRRPKFSRNSLHGDGKQKADESNGTRNDQGA